MKDDKNYAKMYQIAYVLVSRYGFSTQMIKQYAQFINVGRNIVEAFRPKKISSLIPDRSSGHTQMTVQF